MRALRPAGLDPVEQPHMGGQKLNSLRCGGTKISYSSVGYFRRRRRNDFIHSDGFGTCRPPHQTGESDVSSLAGYPQTVIRVSTARLRFLVELLTTTYMARSIEVRVGVDVFRGWLSFIISI